MPYIDRVALAATVRVHPTLSVATRNAGVSREGSYVHSSVAGAGNNRATSKVAQRQNNKA